MSHSRAQSHQTADDHLATIAFPTQANVFHAKTWGLTLGSETIEALKLVAQRHESGRARLCLHPSVEDLHQEMLIVMSLSAKEVPQRRRNGFDTKLILEGSANMNFFSVSGDLLRTICLSSAEGFYHHTRSDEFHALEVVSEWFVFIEVLNGPFDSKTTEFATWLT